MSDYALDIFGKFNTTEILSVRDPQGNFWFSQEVIASALDVDKTALTHVRQNHPAEFTEGDDYKAFVWEGKKRLFYSEEGFMTICDMSQSEVAYRLRKWMRQQFRVKHEGRDIVIEAKGLQREDFSDLGPDIVLMQQTMSAIVEDRRRIKMLEQRHVAIAAETDELKEKVAEHETRLASWEDGAKVKPGEMTAIQLAGHCGWVAQSGAPHNLAVILAATNHGFLERGLMQARREQGPNNLAVEVLVFTPDGIAEFLSEINALYHSGQKFDVAPNDKAIARGLKNRRFVLKR